MLENDSFLLVSLIFLLVIIKNKSNTIFHGMHSLIDHRNDHEGILCSKLCHYGRFHLNFEHSMASFLWSIIGQTMKNCVRFIKWTGAIESYIEEIKNIS